MAIQWGNWESSGGNGIRVGIEVDWDTVFHSSPDVDAVVKIYTQNEFSYNDSQTLTYGGALSGSTNFTNNDGGSVVLRATRTYNYDYSSTSYGSSPGSRTFSASLSGAFNGVTPSKSVTSNVPARPYTSPTAPSSVGAARVSDTVAAVSWSNNAWSGGPWSNVHLQHSINGAAFAYVSTSISGGASSVNVATAANRRTLYRVAAVNSIGGSAWANAAQYVWTTPAAPTSAVRTEFSPTQQNLSWVNNVAYSEYATDIYVSVNGGAWSLVVTKAAGLTTHSHSGLTASNKYKYLIRARCTVNNLYADAPVTTESIGATEPHNAPINLIPSGGASIDPTLPQPLTWTPQPAIPGDTTQQYTVRHRLVGSGTWTYTAAIASAVASHTLAANTYLDGQTVEWQVATKGADALFSIYSASATFTLTVTPITPEPVKLPVLLDLGTGDLEASTTAFEVRDMVARAQILQSGGNKDVDGATLSIAWYLFRVIGKGGSDETWFKNHHVIWCPYGWGVTNKVLNLNVATLTLNVTGGANKARPGDKIVVAGVGAPFDGTFTVLQATSNTVSYNRTNANIASAAATGTVHHVIHGHGGAVDTFPSGGRVQLNPWEALWYELPMRWGTGGEARRNGVVAVTNKALTSNVATLTVVKPHYSVVGDQVTVDIGDVVFDGSYTVSAITDVTVSYAKTNANVASTSATGIVSPNNTDTQFGNFHVVSYLEPFVVPSNWVLIASRIADAPPQIEWGDGTKDTGWRAPDSWGTGWGNYSDANFGASSQVIRRLNGVTYMQGLVARTSGVGTTVFTLPVGFRPRTTAPLNKLFVVYATAALGRLDVNGSTGVVSFPAGTATYVSLNGISFPADV